MPIDTSMYQNMLRPPKSVAEYDAEAMQGQTNKLALMTGQQKADEYQRSVADSNRLRGVVSGFGSDQTANYNALLGAGRLDEAQKYQKGNADLGKINADAAETKSKTKKTDLETASHQFEIAGQLASAWATRPDVTKAQVQAGLAAALHSGVISPEIAQAKMAELTAVPEDPKAINVWANGTLQQVMKAKDSMSYIAPDANAKLGAQTSTDNNVATNATSRANNAATVGASYANAGATRAVAQATRDAAGIQRDQATEMKMADDYRAQSKDFKSVSDAYRQINSTLDKATTSPAATLAAATKFMKLLDPGSVVRESELGMALAATGVFDRATNYFNTLQSGKVLTTNQVKDFKNITEQIYGAAQAGQQSIDANYTKQAQTYKLRPEMIVQDLGQNAKSGAPTKGPIKVTGAADYANVPSGAEYVTPDGHTRRKP